MSSKHRSKGQKIEKEVIDLLGCTENSFVFRRRKRRSNNLNLRSENTVTRLIIREGQNLRFIAVVRNISSEKRTINEKFSGKDKISVKH